MLPTAPLPDPLNEPDLDGHCRRVGGIANLIAHQLFLPTEEKALLQAACKFHHADRENDQCAASVRAVLASFDQGGRGSPGDRKLGAILRIADTFDCEFQAQPVRHQSSVQILSGLRSGIAKGYWPTQILEALEACTKPMAMPSATEWRIPVFPRAAMQTLELMKNQAVSISQVVEAAGRDPATAGAIMKLANSVLFSERGQVASLQAGVARLGFETARKVVTSLAMRPLLALPKLEKLWPHSIEVADLSEQLASRTRMVDSGEAYLAGLLHDIGRIALRSAPLYDAARLQGLEESGCPVVYAEDVILGTDHAAIGSKIGGVWRLPERIRLAIRDHHRPEDSTTPLACLIYLAEFLSGSQEDLPSLSRIDISLNQIGLTKADLADCVHSDVGAWLAAA